MENIFLGKQPILDRNQSLVAYELLFRTTEDNQAKVLDGFRASANVVVNVYGYLGIQRVLGNLRGFININQELLLDDAVLLLPSKHVVLELLETISATPEVVQRCIELKQMGYQLALDDVTRIDDRIEPLLPIINIVKVDVLALTDNEISDLIQKLRAWPVIPLAEKVDSPERARMCMDLGFEMFQGYFFAKPVIVSGSKIGSGKLSLLRLLSLVMCDAKIDEIEQLLKREPGLSYSILRMVNSVAAALPQKIGSIRQAIIAMGYQPLKRWVQLLLYAANPAGELNEANALMQTAAIRGRLMELIAIIDRPHDKNYQDRAFMTGIMSLLDTLFGMEIQQIVDKLEMPDEVIRALVHREGRLGCKLRLIEARERGNAEQLEKAMAELEFLDRPDLVRAELDALDWANHINQPISS
ncbi:MAG TPA: EAL domain-containing protein [Nitrosomonas europaea]|uniref:EAL and HDOD domain-containing protein n=1 Tax=Nitrosomonas europaea TaxID=915 RepID=UPI00249358BF|nr:HDOD domain-containing protein [Nitrosomonas europaea]HNS57649.1 EAL domain-containing protein [Nitrosomonas europaea]HRN81912.1 EAL domain-containing protein [Nitrosomonas europaea]HRO55607.1 EAL domain-containing protein [Nitrosomonas europaea]HRQ08318.1 EAL domain-containing protein [Nitrosomonas europaea]HUM72897.1 EAL domain-containing protein [Nitrosomonas europaea]